MKKNPLKINLVWSKPHVTVYRTYFEGVLMVLDLEVWVRLKLEVGMPCPKSLRRTNHHVNSGMRVVYPGLEFLCDGNCSWVVSEESYVIHHSVCQRFGMCFQQNKCHHPGPFLCMSVEEPLCKVPGEAVQFIEVFMLHHYC